VRSDEVSTFKIFKIVKELVVVAITNVASLQDEVLLVVPQLMLVIASFFGINDEVIPRETVNFITYFTPERAGKYQIAGHVAFEQQSEDKATILNVQNSGANWLLIGGIIVAE